MSNLKTFLKALHKSGYPNPIPDVPTIAKMVSYPIDNFLSDMTNSVGMEGTDNFVEKTFSKLGLMGEGMKIDLSDLVGEPGSYIYLIINGFDLLKDEEPGYKFTKKDEPVWIHYTWGPNELIHDGESKTLEDIYDDVDLGTMGEYGDLIEDIQYECISQIFKKTGLIIHFDSQI
jgi:hypothetical protein